MCQYVSTAPTAARSHDPRASRTAATATTASEPLQYHLTKSLNHARDYTVENKRGFIDLEPFLEATMPVFDDILTRGLEMTVSLKYNIVMEAAYHHPEGDIERFIFKTTLQAILGKTHDTLRFLMKDMQNLLDEEAELQTKGSNGAWTHQEKWCGVVGLEVHAQINSVSKLFSAAATDYRIPVNQSVALFDAAIPGTLPVLNRRCVEAGVITALALKSNLNPVSMFDRKHYFYADLPAGYQITQQRMPLARGGEVQFQVYTPGIHKEPYSKSARLHQLQLEQDSGKSLHDNILNRSLIDLNRAGVPLMELVFEPDLTDGEEAAALVKELTLLLTTLNTCLCKMEEGGMRVDANVSVHKPGTPLGVRTEVKNIGSIRGVARAVNYEIQRQRDILHGGGRVVNETRAWDAENNCTVAMRDKEEKQDYRFMPEPNLPPLRLDMDGSSRHPHAVSVPELRAALPELPEQTRLRLQTDHGLSPLMAVRLVNEPQLLNMFDAVLQGSSSRNPSTVANLLAMELLTLVNKDMCTLGSGRPSSEDIGEITDLLKAKRINLQTARFVLETIASGEKHSASDIVTSHDLWLVTERAQILAICEEAIQRNPKIVEAYKKGKTKVFKALLGDIVKVTQNRADMSLVTKQLEDLLKGS